LGGSGKSMPAGERGGPVISVGDCKEKGKVVRVDEEGQKGREDDLSTTNYDRGVRSHGDKKKEEN